MVKYVEGTKEAYIPYIENIVLIQKKTSLCFLEKLWFLKWLANLEWMDL